MKTDNLITETQLKLSVLERLEVCRDMVANKIDLNKVKRSFTYTYAGKVYKIGSWLSVVRHSDYSQGVRDALMDLGFSLDDKHQIVDTDLKIEILSDMLKKGADINKILQRASYIYNGISYNVGRWLFSCKYYGADPVLSKKLEEWGFDFSKATLNNLPADKKIEVLKDMIAHDIDINSIRRKDTYTYNGIEYPVGEWINVVREKRCGEALIKSMRELGLKDGKVRELDYQMREEVLTHMRDNGYDIASIKLGDTYEYMGEIYPVGLWTHRNYRNVKSGVLRGYIAEVNSSMIKRDRYSLDRRFEVLDDMVANGIDISKVPLNEVYTYNGQKYKVGSWLAKARSGQTSQEFIAGLEKYGFDYTKRTKYYSNEVKLAVIKDMVAQGIDLNKCNVKTTHIYKGVKYEAGTWIFHARRNIVDQEFVNSLARLGLRVRKPEERRKNIGKTKKLEVLRHLQSQGIDISQIDKGYKYQYNGVEYNVGNWLHDKKRPHLSQSLYETLNVNI